MGLSRPCVIASPLIDTDGDVEQGIPRGKPSSNAEPFFSTFIVPSGVAGAMPPFTGAIGHMLGLFNRGCDSSSSNAPAVGEYSNGVFEMASPEWGMQAFPMLWLFFSASMGRLWLRR